MTFKKVKVVMLPTNEKSKLVLSYCNELAINWTHDLAKFDDATYQNLYFLSDEEIKEGDLVLFMFDEVTEIVRVTTIVNNAFDSQKGFGYGLDYCKKIIATTDRLNMHPNIADSYRSGNCLPQPSQSFVEKFVEEYNEGNVITEVIVEYNDIFTSNQGLGYNETVTCKIVKIDGDDVYGEYISSSGVDEDDVDLKTPYSLSSLIKEGNQIGLKINPKDNTITIRKVKDSWNRDEVRELLITAYSKGRTNRLLHDFNEWLKENL